jgi:hypothetical protein
MVMKYLKVLFFLILFQSQSEAVPDSAILNPFPKQLKATCKFTKEELDSCKVRMKPKEGDPGFQTDSSCEDGMSREDRAFNKGALTGIGAALKEAPKKFIEGFADLLLNTVSTVEGIIGFLENLPEMPGHIFAYLETIEGDEEAKGEEIAKFITEQLLTLASPNKVKLLQKVSKTKLGLAAVKIAEQGIKLTKKGRDRIGTLIQCKDKTVREVLKIRGGNASALTKMRTDYIDKALGEIANLAATGDSDAGTAMKIVKEAKRLAEKY